MYKVSLPAVFENHEEIMRRYARIKPIVEVNGQKHFLREFSEEEVFTHAYINDPSDVIMEESVNTTLFISRPNDDFECIHSYGYYGIFKPSIAEVLSQIPDTLLDFVDGFEIIDYPRTPEDFNKHKVEFYNHFHVSTVRLYTSRDNPNVIFA